VMHVLARQEIASQHLLHDQDVLEDVAAVARLRVLRSPDQRVPVSVPAPLFGKRWRDIASRAGVRFVTSER
jgi:hypothetical protein